MTLEPSVITIGAIHGGNRGNIIPDSVEMIGTIRTYNEGMRGDIHKRITRTAQSIAQSGGGSAETTITMGYDVTTNPDKLSERAAASLRRTMADAGVFQSQKSSASEDFSAYQNVVPGFFFFIGAQPKNVPPEKLGPNHSPLFQLDEAYLKTGVKALANLTLDYLNGR